MSGWGYDFGGYDPIAFDRWLTRTRKTSRNYRKNTYRKPMNRKATKRKARNMARKTSRENRYYRNLAVAVTRKNNEPQIEIVSAEPSITDYLSDIYDVLCEIRDAANDIRDTLQNPPSV